MRTVIQLTSVLLIGLTAAVRADDAAQLPTLPPKRSSPPTDWLIDASPYQACVYRSDKPGEIVLCNGLLRRTFTPAFTLLHGPD